MRRGWYGEKYRHYLAAKGIPSKYARKNPLQLSLAGSFIAGTGQSVLGSQDPTEGISKRMRASELERRKGVLALSKAEAARSGARAKMTAEPARREAFSPGEQEYMRALPSEVIKYRPQSEVIREEQAKTYKKQQQKIVDSLIGQYEKAIAQETASKNAERSNLVAKLTGIQRNEQAIMKRSDINPRMKAIRLQQLNNQRAVTNQELNRLETSGFSRQVLDIQRELASAQKELKRPSRAKVQVITS